MVYLWAEYMNMPTPLRRMAIMYGDVAIFKSTKFVHTRM